jgi:hypothetical protein
MHKNYPTSSSDSSKPILDANTKKGDPGDAAIVANAVPASLGFPADSDGSNVDYSNNTTEIYVIEGNETLAKGTDNDGWYVDVSDISNCTITTDKLVITVTEITSNTGEVTLRVAKPGYNDLYVTIWLNKQLKGEQGEQGEQGIQGPQGLQGVQGPSGDVQSSYAIIKRRITVKEIDYPTRSNNGGNLRLTYPSAHNLTANDLLWVVYYENESILGSHIADELTIVSDTIIDVNVTYRDDDVYVRDMKYLGFDTEDDILTGFNSQVIGYKDILPVGAQLDTIAIQKNSGTEAQILWSASYNTSDANNSGDLYMNQQLAGLDSLNNKPLQVNLWNALNTSPSAELKSIVERYIHESNSQYRNVYFEAKLSSPLDDWGTTVSDNVYDIFISYKYFGGPTAEEQEDTFSITVDPSTTENVVIGDTTTDEVIILDMKVRKGTKLYSQQANFVWDGTSLHMVLGEKNPYIAGDASLGVTLGKNLNGTEIQMSIQNTNGAESISVTYKITKL